MIISVASGKGGTGKTTLAVSLATALATNVHLNLTNRDYWEARSLKSGDPCPCNWG